MKYIDAERLKAEIGELDNQFRTGNYYLDNSEQVVGYQNALTDICGIIDSLQQEQPEVDLEEYIENEINHYGLSLYKASYGTFSASEIDRIIRNAFEFGLNARKEE